MKMVDVVPFFIVGGIFTFILGGAVNGCAWNNHWRIDAVKHKAAHWDVDSVGKVSWHWNDEAKETK